MSKHKPKGRSKGYHRIQAMRRKAKRIKNKFQATKRIREQAHSWGKPYNAEDFINDESIRHL